MTRRASAGEPVFGSDSFLDVTANLVGVLIILIVLVGMRVMKAPPELYLSAATAEFDRRLGDARRAAAALEQERDELSRQFEQVREGLSAKNGALAQWRSRQNQILESEHELTDQLAAGEARLADEAAQVDEAHARLVALGGELGRLRAGAAPPRQLVYRSPLSRPVESEEIHL